MYQESLLRKITFGWLLAAFAIGLLLRWFYVSPMAGINYKFMLHTHSHIALLGWVFVGLYLSLVNVFIPVEARRRYYQLFWWMQLSLLGMLFSFPFQGYAAISISFSTLFVITTYILSVWYFRDLKADKSVSASFLRHGLLFLVISSLGAYFLGYLRVNGLETTHWYNNAVYFYLHFLYNGFFMWGVAAWALRRWEARGEALPLGQQTTWLLVASTWLTFALSVLWIHPPWIWYAGGVIGAAIQLWLAVRWLLIRKDVRRHFLGLHAWMKWISRFLLVFIFLKLVTQLLSGFPEIASWVFASKIFTIIGYIHLIMLGILTPYLILTLFPQILSQRGFAVAAICYLLGFLITEGILFGYGLLPQLTSIANAFPLLFGGYLFIGISLLQIAWHIQR